MALLTFDNYKDQITATLLKKANKLLVRDVDEESKNHFIAYVDDGDKSYDVSITTNQSKEIIATYCDCDKTVNNCVHKIAFLNFYFSKKFLTVKSIRKKKPSHTEDLLKQLHEDELKLWVLNLFKTNKDLEILFCTAFAKTFVIYDKKSVKLIIDASIKSVVKNRKNIDSSEITKIVTLLEVSLLPVLDYCKTIISTLESYNLLYFVYNEIFDFHNRTYSSGVKLIRFYEKIYKDIIHHIQSFQDSDLWKSILKNYFVFFDDIHATTLHFELLFYFYNSIADNGRKKIFAKQFYIVYEDITLQKKYFSIEFNEFILKVISENSLFEQCYSSFAAIRYANKYNLFLINKLLEIEKIDEATAMAVKQIELNSNSVYDTDYYKILESIYRKTNNLLGLASLNIYLIQHDYSFKRYLNIKANWKNSEKEFVLFRTQLLTACKRNFQEQNDAKFLYFDILNSYQNYSQMFESITSNISYEVVFKFKEIFFEISSIQFLTSLNSISFENGYLLKSLQDKENDYRNKLLDWVIKNYDMSILKQVTSLKNRYEVTFFEAIRLYFKQN